MKIRSEIVLILIFSLANLQGLFSQDLGTTYELAAHHFEKGQYTTALKHYQRVVFFSSDTLLQESFLGVARCHTELNHLEEAQRYYDLAYQNSTSDSLANSIMFEKARYNIMNGRYQYAQVDLYNIFPRNEEEQSRLHFFNGMAYFKLHNFDSAQSHLSMALPLHDSTAHHQIDSLFRLNAKFHNRLNPKTARILSMIIPGSGQLYAGNMKEALNSLAITFGFGYLTYNTAVNISVLDGFVSVFPWFFRYYLGGYNNAEELTKKQIQKRENQILGAILIVMSNATSSK